jgi:hypothetical protein
LGIIWLNISVTLLKTYEETLAFEFGVIKNINTSFQFKRTDLILNTSILINITNLKDLVTQTQKLAGFEFSTTKKKSTDFGKSMVAGSGGFKNIFSQM